MDIKMDTKTFELIPACAVCNVKRWVACDFYRDDVERMVDQIVQCG